MRKFLTCLIVVLLAPISQAYASDVGFSVGINFGVPGVVAPAYAPQPVVIDEPPVFVEPPELGFYVAAGVPYDLFFIGNLFYLFSGDVWYASPYYNGPWSPAYFNDIPYSIRRYPFERIHYYRDDYFRRYHDYGDRRGFSHFRPGWHGVDREGHRGVYNNPGRQDQGNWNRPVYNTPNRTGNGAWNRPVYNNPGRPNQGNWNRPVYNAPNRTGNGTGNRPVYNNPGRPAQVNWNKPAYNAPNRTDRGNAGRAANNGPNRHERGNSGTEGRGR